MNRFLFFAGIYFRRIFLDVILVSLCAVLALSVMFYFRIREDLTRQALDDNTATLQKTIYFTESMNSTVKTLLSTLFKDPDIQQIMYSANPDEVAVFRTIINMKSYIFNNYPFIKHFYIYNYQNGKVYSTRGNFDTIPDDLMSIIPIKGKSLMLRPYTHTLPGSGDPSTTSLAVTYYLYDYIDSSGHPKGAVLLDISLDWLTLILHSESAGNSFDQPFEGLIALDSDNKPLSQDARVNDLFNAFLLSESADLKRDMDMFPVRIGKEDYLISNRTVPSMGWNLLRFQLASRSYRALLDWQKRLIMINLFGIGIILLVALLVVHDIYKPIQKLIMKTGPSARSSGRIKDEFRYIESVLTDRDQELSQLKSTTQTMRKMREEQDHWRQILTGETVKTPPPALEWQWKECTYRTCVISVQDFHQLKEKWTSEKLAILGVSIGDVYTSLFPTPILTVMVQKNQMVLVVPAIPEENLCSILNGGIEFINRQSGARIVAAYSDIIEDPNDLSKAYAQSIVCLKYHFMQPDRSVFSPEVVRPNEYADRHEIDPNLFTGLKQSILAGNVRRIHQDMETIRTQLIEMAFIDVEVELMRLVSALRRIVDDWNKIRIEPAHFDASRLSQGIRSVETLEEALLAIEQTATQLSSLSDIDMECRNDARIHAYQEYLVQHIADPNLCVSIVADHFKISVKQMNRIFKSMTGLTASDYLTGIRMERASELLTHSNAKVQDVAQAVGIINTNYFFTLFKKRFGVTPKDFQIANHPRR